MWSRTMVPGHFRGEQSLPFTQQILAGIRSTRPPLWDEADLHPAEFDPCCASPPARCFLIASSGGIHQASTHHVSLVSPRHTVADIIPGLADRGDEWLRPSIDPSSRLLHLTHSRTYAIASNPFRIRDVGSRTEIVSPACAPIIRPSSHGAAQSGREARRGNARRVTGSTVMGLSNNLDLTFAFPRSSSRGVAFSVAADVPGGRPPSASRRPSSARRLIA